MPPRPIWKGAISFGMVVIPIRLYIATESKDVAFVTLHATCKTRLRQRRWCPTHDAEVPNEEIVRGYEYAKDQYVVMEEADFEGLPVPSIRTIEITRFVEMPTIDPIYFERSYYLEPDGVGVKPFYLLKRALEESGRVAVAKVSLRQKEHLCTLRPHDRGLVMATMYYPDEIRPTAELNFPEEEVALSPVEMQMATMLIDQLTGEFEPEQYRDEYRETLHRAIEAKLGAGEVVAAAPPPSEGRIRDLTEALRASIEAVRRQREESAAATAEDATEARPRKRAQRAG